MPELPDVEIFRRYLNATSLHQEIERVEIRRSRQMLEGVSARTLRTRLEGHAFDAVRRHGKYVFAGLDGGDWLVLHFGMTGYPAYFRDIGREPPHARLLMGFANGFHLAYVSQRMFGTISMTDDVEGFVTAKRLGPDALAPDLDLDAFRGRLSGRRATAKSALLNQRIIAGIGNIYSDEILFQAGVHPSLRIDRLDEEAVRRLFHSMKRVLNTAIEKRVDPDRFPRTYIAPRRGPGGRCPKCGRELIRERIAGRSAYYCPHHQKGRRGAMTVRDCGSLGSQPPQGAA